MYKVRKTLIRILPLLGPAIFLFLLQGCSTQKDSFINRAFHQINAKYNGYFNAKEIYNESLKTLSEAHVDNYEDVLSVFRYGTEQDAASISGNMDVIYEKASLVIRRHSMDIRGEEHNKWIDETYYLIGRSHFFKHDFTLAILTFEYIIRQYDTRRSHDAKVWIAKSYHEQERYEQALRLLETLERRYRDGLLKDETVAMFRKAYADHFIRQDMYERAAAQLEAGLPYVKGRNERARLTFIQAQLYQHSGQFARAQETYERVLDMRASREMRFQARIGMAQAYDPSVGGSDFIRDELMDMLGQSRYEEFQDQIYYALAQLYMRQDDEESAIEHYLISTEVSRDNNLQKGLSFLRLGEIYFEQPDYEQANLYYDSANTFLPASYDEIEVVRERQQVLSGLAQLSEVIAVEDSLQHLASLSDDEQQAIVAEIIKDLEEQERQRQEAERQRQQEMREAGRMAREGQRGAGGSRQGGGWYFYNTSAMSNGEMEFFSNFGERPLEDLWRISNRQMAAADFGDFGEMESFDDLLAGEEDTLDLDEHDPETYLRNIPNSEEQMALSVERQVQAYFNKAMLFRDRLNDLENAIQSFTELVNNFDGSGKEMQAYYYLYHMHRETGNHAAAEQIKNTLLENYPDSEYAMIIGDPDYAENIRQRQNLANELYEQSYSAFFAGRYDIISQNRAALDTLEVERELKAKFSYLHAMALGKNDDHELFLTELQYVVDNYEGTPVHQPASVLLASLHEEQEERLAAAPEQVSRPERDPIESPYDYNPDAVHFFLLLVQTEHQDPARVSNAITSFNEEHFEEESLSVNNVYFEEGKQLLTITNFQNMESGLDYFLQWQEHEQLETVRSEHIEPFVISVNNYPTFYQDKKVEDYRVFFDYYYLGI